MGNTSSEQSQSLFKDISEHYLEVRTEGRGTVLEHRTSHCSYLLKEYTFGNELSFQTKLQQL